MSAENYPQVPRQGITEEVHGHLVPDPYRWLEDAGSAQTMAWLAAQDELYDGFLASRPGLDKLTKRLAELMASGLVSPPSWRGDRRFLTRRSRGQQHPVLYTHAPDEGERVLIDPMAIDQSGTTTLDRWEPDHRGRLLAYQSVPAAVGQGLGPWTPNAGYIVPAVESLDPLFHLFNGDLCYANVSDAPVATWASFFNNNTWSAANRPWMPSAGNHENEVGNGPQGYLSYQTRFALPDNGSDHFRGNWYAFTVGSIRVISLNNDDVCLQDGGFSAFRRDHVPTYVSNADNPYINGYSSGEQKRWLERELAEASRSGDIDWIVVCMHQVSMSSAHFNGADLGIRQNWLPLFDRYGVDLVVAGHEHHFERTFPVRGTLPGSTVLTPAPHGTDPYLMDTSAGTVHMIIGGGGHSAPTPVSDFDMPHDGVLITSVGPGSPQSQHPPITTTEPAPWSAYRDLQTPYGFASFDFVPHEPGGTTSITVTHYGADAGSSVYSQRDQFVMRKPLGRGRRHDQLTGTATAG